MTEELLTRDEFRSLCLKRDNGEYFLSNGAKTCPECHMLAEQTKGLSQIR